MPNNNKTKLLSNPRSCVVSTHNNSKKRKVTRRTRTRTTTLKKSTNNGDEINYRCDHYENPGGSPTSSSSLENDNNKDITVSSTKKKINMSPSMFQNTDNDENLVDNFAVNMCIHYPNRYKHTPTPSMIPKVSQSVLKQANERRSDQGRHPTTTAAELIKVSRSSFSSSNSDPREVSTKVKTATTERKENITSKNHIARYILSNKQKHYGKGGSLEQNKSRILNGSTHLKKKLKINKYNQGSNKPRTTTTTRDNSSKKRDEKKRLTVIESKETKTKRIQENAKRRQSRMIDTKKRREKMEIDMTNHRRVNSGFHRQQRLKMKAEKERRRKKLSHDWLMLLILGARIQGAASMISNFREYHLRLDLEDKAARIITRQMQKYKLQMYRKRIRGAIRVLASLFLVKVRLWTKSRRRVASDKIRAFLLAVERENNGSGGLIALIVKGKKWRAYRLKIILLQQWWRCKLRVVLAQVLLIDEQWKQEQHRRTAVEIENIFVDEQRRIISENEHIDNVNRTRKIIKLRPLALSVGRTREEIRVDLLKGNDLLSIGHIIPAEIRHKLIRDLLTLLRRHFINQIKLYEQALKEFQKDRQRRRALLVKFSDNSWIWGRWSSQAKMNQLEKSHQEIIQPMKPLFHIMLSEDALSALMAIGKLYTEDLRNNWNPQSMSISQATYDINEVVRINTK